MMVASVWGLGVGDQLGGGLTFNVGLLWTSTRFSLL